MMQKKQIPDPKLEELLKKPEIQTWRAIMGAYKSIFSILESYLQKDGFTVPRFQIMFYLYFEGPHAPMEIAAKLKVSRGNISTFFKRMLSDNLIKEASSIVRPKYILTPKGRKKFESIFPVHVKRVVQLVHPLDPRTIEKLQNILSKNDF